jgi:predicted membrane-bound mannosyltransferase
MNTLLQVLVYSAIPYKTPWNMMGFYHGLIIIAAYGIYQVFNTNMKLSNRIIPVVFTLAGSLHLIIQAFLLNFKTPTDPYHPYVYAQTGNDIFEIVSRIDSVSSANPLGKEMPVDVIFPGHDYWPLPWYLRTYKNVGYREHVDLNQPAAPLILSSPDVEKEIIHYLYEAPPPGEKYLYVPLFDTYMELRPMVEIKGYLRKDAWDHFNQARFR